MELKIGTTGWSYSAWQGSFYPKPMEQKNWLKFYSSVFDATEVNSSFYRPIPAWMARKWHSETPPEFRFTLKFPKSITHDARLDYDKAQADMNSFFSGIEPLKSKISSLVIQLPPSMSFDEAQKNLEVTSKHFPRYYRYAIEGRDESWFSDDSLEYLSSKNYSLVWSEVPMVDNPAPITTDFVYLRIIGDRALPDDTYSGIVRDKTDVISKWADKLDEIKGNLKIKLALAFTNNHLEGFSPTSANKLRKLCGLSELEWKDTRQKTIADY